MTLFLLFTVGWWCKMTIEFHTSLRWWPGQAMHSFTSTLMQLTTLQDSQYHIGWRGVPAVWPGENALGMGCAWREFALVMQDGWDQLVPCQCVPNGAPVKVYVTQRSTAASVLKDTMVATAAR